MILKLVPSSNDRYRQRLMSFLTSLRRTQHRRFSLTSIHQSCLLSHRTGSAAVNKSRSGGQDGGFGNKRDTEVTQQELVFHGEAGLHRGPPLRNCHFFPPLQGCRVTCPRQCLLSREIPLLGTDSAQHCHAC